MGVKIKTKVNNIPQIIAGYKQLAGKKIEVGVFGEQAWLAGIHEYGCNITPKNAKYLTVPCCRKAYGKRAADFSDLFFLETDSGQKFLVREKGKDELEFMFWLTKSVHIPERSFLRAGHDTNIDEVMKKVDRLAGMVGHGMNADELCNEIGLLMASKIKKYARDLNDPPKSNVTVAAEGGKTNPLVNTGDMIGAITYRVER